MKIKHIVPKKDGYNHATHMICPCEPILIRDTNGSMTVQHRPMDYTWEMLHLIDGTNISATEQEWIDVNMINNV